MKRKQRILSGTKSTEVTQLEAENRKCARKAAAEGIVLLENEDVLPIGKDEKLALFGAGAGKTIKGGTGSGDVNVRETVSVYQGLKAEGMEIVSEVWIKEYDQIYQNARESWKSQILQGIAKVGVENAFTVYASHTFEMPAGNPIRLGDIKEADTAMYVISRIAGEGADRYEKPGDYYLAENEKEDLRILSENCSKLIVVINAGGQIDVEEILALPCSKAVLFLCQAGMEAGLALADVVTGKVTPGGKLTDTWAKRYMDYPNAGIYSHNNGNVDSEEYQEGIYVGYRYFDSFSVEPRYPFGYGKSYTEFEITAGLPEIIEAADTRIQIPVKVSNIGATYSGKEVVQIYASCPQNNMAKEYRKLCAFAKTKQLEPGESQELFISFPGKALASFREELGAWIVEQGLYGIWAGNSSKQLTICGVLKAEEDTVMEQVTHICRCQDELKEFAAPTEELLKREKQWQSQAEQLGLTPITVSFREEQKPEGIKMKLEAKAAKLTEQLSDEELVSMVVGEVSKGQYNALGAAGIMVPGAAGETSGALEKTWNVAGISMADGPAGLRLQKEYMAEESTMTVYNQGVLGSIEDGFFSEEVTEEGTEKYYQYCTAMPVGTQLAQSWNTELLEEAGHAVALEMNHFGISWWLAPGMNIHRNPLCGRNFEYYSEDPLVSGVMAAAMTRGVQSVPGAGTTVKHFACNNQEDNRMGSNSIVSERALREIYLRGFEIAVKTAQPMAMMTSYNRINGVHAANNRDLCDMVARKEWGFAGIIMTDWTTTSPMGGSISWKCVAAGNDLIMPGDVKDKENILQALQSGALTREELKACVKRMLNVIFQTVGYEDSRPYSEQFSLEPYVKVKE